MKKIAAAGEPSISFACQDVAQAKAAYRFFSNPHVNEHAILSGHMNCTRDRVQAVSGTVLVLHDTTQISYSGNAEEVGFLSRVARRTICDRSVHSSLVVTPQGLPLASRRHEVLDTQAVQRAQRVKPHRQRNPHTD